MIDAPSATAWCVYGIVPASSAGRAAERAGVGLVEHGGLAAAVGEVPLAEFGPEVLPARLEDRAWLERTARAHEAVLRGLAAESPVVPLRFGAIYRRVEDVRGLLESRADAFEAALDRVRGRVEVGVKAWVDGTSLRRAVAAGAPDEAGGGRAYMQARLRERNVAGALAARAAELAAEAHERLLACAVEGVANRPQPHELTGRDEAMLLNGAYLVPEGDTALADEVRRLAAEHRPLGVTYETTGPWPPYNFVGPEDGAP